MRQQLISHPHLSLEKKMSHELSQLSVIISLIGFIIYIFTHEDRPRYVEIGRLMFAIGLLAFLIHYSPKLF